MARPKIQLLGAFRIFDGDGNEAAAPSRKGQALLAYLALAAGQLNTRDRLAGLLWGDRFDEQARHSLRQCVLNLRKVLDDREARILVSDGDRLVLDGAAAEVDARRFEALSAGTARAQLEEAMALYGGTLLDGLDVRSEGFDEWLARERSRLRDLAADTLGRLMALYAESGDSQAAIDAAERLLALDPVREEAHRMLMRLYERSGRRSTALRQYQVCEEAVRRELDAEPEPETVRLFTEMRNAGRDALPAAAEAPAAPAAAAPVPPAPRRRPPIRIAAAVGVLVLAAVAGGVWVFDFRGSSEAIEIASSADMAFPLPKKPSIAVLPFHNLGGDEETDNLVDGITEGITTALSMISHMFVISRTTALTYKGKPVKTRRVAEELGVRYVLEGTVQKSGNRIRVSARLIDALKGTHVWAELYDRETKEIFALQDEITLEIATALQVRLMEGEQERIALRHGTKDLQAWILAARGLRMLRRLTREDNARARELYHAATTRDPNYAGAWDGLAWTHFLDARFGWSASREESVNRASELARKTLALDPSRPRTHILLAIAMLMKGDHRRALELGEKAIRLSPSGAEITALFALLLTYTGEYERSLVFIRRAMRLSPYYPVWYRWNLGRIYRLLGRHEDAVAVLNDGRVETANAPWPRVELTAAYSEMGRAEEARAEAAQILALNPGFSAGAWVRFPPHSDPEVMRREIAILRAAGLPE